MKKLANIAHGGFWFLWFMLGASLFSFAGLAAGRIPKGKTVVRGRSRCLSCGSVLKPVELIPCFSYFIQRGRCRRCGEKIPFRDLWTEVLGGLSACAAVLRWNGDMARAALVLLVLMLLTIVAMVDYDTMEIYDRFHVLLLLCGGASVWIFPEIRLSARLTGCLILSGSMLIMALLIPGGWGGGDIKLAFALGFLLGWRGIVCAAFLSIFAAGLWCVWKRAGRKEQFAFAPFLCGGAAAALFYGNELVEWWLRLAIL